MKTKVLSILLALLMVFSLVFAASADARTQHETEPCDHDHAALSEAHEHLHEHKELPPVERTFAPVKGEEIRPVETPEAVEETEEPVIVPTEVPEPTPVVDPTEVPEETEEPEPTPVVEPTEIPEETEKSETCPHENTWSGWYWKDDPAYTDTEDNTWHEVSGIRVNYTYCWDCNSYVTEQEEEYAETEEHRYNENGICEKCGHVNTCPHTHTSEGWNWNHIETYTDTGDNLTHEASGTRVCYTYCWDCWHEIANHEEAYTGPQEHYYENGVCVYCGHVNTCAHENTREDWYWSDCSYTDTGDNRMHEITGIRIWETQCEDCHAVIAEREEAFSSTQEHSYDENGVCSECGHINTCSHEVTCTDRYLIYKDEAVYEDIGDNLMHHVIGTRQVVTYCMICEMIFSVEEEPYDGMDYHTYDENGVCIYCGHSNTCPHRHQDTYCYWKNQSENSYTDTGDNLTHMTNGIAVYVTYCADCRKELASWEEKHSEPENHDYEDAVCTLCGHVNACPHEHTETYPYQWTDWDFTYTDLNENEHVVSSTCLYVVECHDCNMVVDVYEDEYGYKEPHVLNGNGVCEYCGHGCAHEHTYDGWYWKKVDSYTDTGDNQTHEASGVRVLYTYCKDCGIDISKHAEAYTGPQNHSYEDGVCPWCGHVNTCPHENVKEYPEWKEEDWSYTDTGDNMMHELSRTRIIRSYCKDCHTWLTEREEPYAESEHHSYDENGVCSLCGHVNTCPHEHTYTFDTWDYETCTFTDTGSNLTHEVSGDRLWYSACEDCDMWILERREHDAGTEHHSYDEGICVLCGHENTCTHEHTTEWRFWDDPDACIYTDTGDSQTHQRSGLCWIDTWCDDCNEWLSGREEYYTATEAHDYDENGVCAWCGHVNTAVEISVAVSRGGSVHGAGTYHVGETVTLIAKAEKGYVFGGWKENGKLVSRSDAYTFTAEADRELTAVFFLKGARIDPVVRPIDPIKPITPIKPIGTVR